MRTGHEGLKLLKNTGSTNLTSELLSADQLKLQHGTDFTYVSNQVGNQFLSNMRLLGQEREVLETLNVLADQLRPLEIGVYEEMEFLRDSESEIIPELRMKLLSTTLKLKYIGSGHFGSVYSVLTESGLKYALKIFYQRNSEDFSSGPWGETATAIYITENKVSNMPHLCMASPSAGWMLSEFVDVDYESTCPFGPTWADLGFEIYDLKRLKENQIETNRGIDIRVEFGHMNKRNNLVLYSCSDLSELLNSLKKKNGYVSKRELIKLYEANPSLRKDILFNLSYLNPEDRLPALKIMPTYPEADFLYLQDYLTNGIISYEQTREIFDMLMTHKNPKVRAQGIFNIHKISNEDANYLGKQWYSRPEFLPFLVYLGEKSFSDYIDSMALYTQEDATLLVTERANPRDEPKSCT